MSDLEARVKQLEKDSPGGFWFVVLMLLAYAWFLRVEVTTVPRVETDRTGHRFLCWDTDGAWPWEDQERDVLSCVRVNHDKGQGE